MKRNSFVLAFVLSVLFGNVFANEYVEALFPKTVDEVDNFTQKNLSQAEKDLEAIIALDEKDRTFDNTIRAYDLVDRKIQSVIDTMAVLEMVHPDSDVREASTEAILSARGFSVDMMFRVEFYKAFLAQEGKHSGEHERYVKKMLFKFKLAGLHLPAEKLARVKVLQKEINRLRLDFANNISLDGSSIHVEKHELAGVAKHFIDNLEKDDEGKYVVPCTYPARSQVLSHCSVANTRMLFDRAMRNRAYPVNKVILEGLISRGDELASLMGYKSFADYDIAIEMAGSADAAEKFILDIASSVEDKARAEFKRLVSDLPYGVSLVDGKLASWDVGYARGSYKKKHFSLDKRMVAEYFPVEKTLDGVFGIYQRFLGLKFKVTSPENLWHEDVRLIEASKDGKVIGYIILDLFPRDSKYSHACCESVVPPLKSEDNPPSVSIIVANFPKPTEDRPSLLTHYDVIVFFHEFGHATHHQAHEPCCQTFGFCF